jgi:predicted house-cleaning noncanonical NTP pyrophosphatase (MazG superfamily)
LNIEEHILKKVYNKLVRDLIPEIIENSGKKCSIEILELE